MTIAVEAVTVCVHYADFLAETVRWNHQHFDHWTIITTPDDKETIELCRRWNLGCITTGEFYSEGKFNKGRGISLGLNYINTDAWVLHLDADIVLPPQFRRMLTVAGLDRECIYGCDRVNVRSWEEWQEFQRRGYLHAQHGYHLCCNFPEGKSVGTRVIRGKHGYVPIGFFQMWHNKEGIHSGMRWKDYPDCNSDAGHSDIKFAMHWDRRRRILLPEVVVLHLESEPAPMGHNWKGRKTKRFGPEPPAPPQTAAPS
jgi:hypothetical protein